jgi:predicted DCC family thiol-disulfide oxidoreductase YuxK
MVIDRAPIQGQILEGSGVERSWTMQPTERPIAPRSEPEAWIIYDGQCPFCSRYVRLVRLRDSLGQVELVDARNGGPIVDEAVRAGLDLDDGMVLKIGDRLYHGHDCIHMLALLTTPSGAFNRINGAIFSSRKASRLLYPFLRAGRNATLRLLGRTKMNRRAPEGHGLG